MSLWLNNFTDFNEQREEEQRCQVFHSRMLLTDKINENPVQRLHVWIKAADEGFHWLYIDKNPHIFTFTLCQTQTKHMSLH